MSVGSSNDVKFNESVPHSNSTIQGVQHHSTWHPTIVSDRDHPMPCTCPNCHQSILTRIEKTNGVIVWISAGALCAFGCFFGCCLIPFYIDSLKDTTHYCPNCSTIIARHKIL
ncbi:unnamed protein product [Adineta steineri]|uniref:LITAF domain-containing protein n=1 Tax=Adineta steineri TaxID=433720 RepID=A0A818IM20_9BILA|nr:unnamed protein product [Adineta steineri]